jgi:iron(III) transport system ATP-binding protein
MQVSFEKIDQSYGRQTLFRSLDLVIPSGQFFTLLGPSGCGKTTLLRMLAGFVRPDRGRVLFGNENVTSIPVHRRGVGIVFQDYALFPDRSVMANVSYGLLARGMARQEAFERSASMLERVGLGAFLDRAPAALSGGQRQRVAMARALVIEPKVLLLDEPLSALDVKLRVELRSMIRTLQIEAGITTVFVTHDQEEALAVSDQIAVMNRGEIVQIGSPLGIYTRPRTAFAADFVGGANVIPIIKELASRSDGLRRMETPAGILLTRSDAHVPDGASLAVRGADISIADASPVKDGEIAGSIVQVEYRGHTVGYSVQTSIGPIRVDASASQGTRLRTRGESVVLRVPHSSHIVEGTLC